MITVIAFLMSSGCFYLLGRRQGIRKMKREQEKAQQQLVESTIGLHRMANESIEELKERARHSIFMK